MKEITDKTVIYSSTYRLRPSFKEVFRFYYTTLIRYKQFMWVNFMKYFKASYQQSFLRLLWKIILPLVPVSVYVLLQQLGLLRGSSDMPHVIYVVVGMTFWQLFSNSLTLAMNAPQKEKAMLKKVNMPFILFSLSAMGDVVFDYIIRMILIVILFVIFQIPFNLTWLLLPFMFLPVTILGFSCGCFFSFFSVFFSDIKNIVDIGIRYGLFASGVIFPMPKIGGVFDLLRSNPIFILLDNMRELLVFSRFSNMEAFILTIAASLFFLGFVLKKLYSLEPRMREFL